MRSLLLIPLALLPLLASGVEVGADDPVLALIDAHGVTVSAVVPKAEGEELLLNLHLTPLGRDLLLEEGTTRPDNHERFARLGEDDAGKVIAAIGQCYRWYDHLFNGAAYSAEQLRLPTAKPRYARVYWGAWSFTWYECECKDGYWANYRQRSGISNWWFNSGRGFAGQRGSVQVKLQYSRAGDTGMVLVDNETVFEGKPGADTFEGEFSRRFSRSRLWEQIDTDSFQLLKMRLRLLLGTRYNVLKGMLRTHPEQLRYQMVLRPGPSAGTGFIKAVEYMQKQGLSERSTITVGGEAKSSRSALVLPRGLLARGDLEGRIAVQWDKATERTKESRFRVEYGELRSSIATDRSAYLYLIALQQAITCVRRNMPENTQKELLGNVLAESEMKFRSR